MNGGSRHCDYCDNGCARCQPRAEPTPSRAYDANALRRLLRIQAECLKYAVQHLQPGTVPLSRSKRDESLEEAMTAIQREIQLLEEHERNEEARKKARRAQQIAAIESYIALLTEEANKLKKEGP